MTDGYPLPPVSLETGLPAADETTTPGEPDVDPGMQVEPDPDQPFATTEDLEARWHALTEEERVRAEALLDDASDLIRSTCPRWEQASDATLKRITCMVVKRAMQAGPDLDGVTQATQTAGSYSESRSYSNPAGDLYLKADEKEALGGSGTSWSYDMAGGST
ncbi:Gp19/Gp15/Gp42 family protein [Bifidobacterium biavatii]|uniref:Phage protein Gp19/Gp15/Gp42 n=1 Tax=Bifidobacterium biavatii DSM 23969 TaxID=1437608 RepID=A0A086ZU17_9BIFI|nr:Gp19/Gp15/Gp42 family protein [Bifidobacterium biavatii]KFI50017.1 Phage protein Gp19/Gp15/Gp42 [Bifidobacterium biavatii DSM 23969]